MKRLLLMAIFIMVGLLPVCGATSKIYADFSHVSLSSEVRWDVSTKTMSWTRQWSNQIRGLGLPTGDLMDYEKIVVECADLKAQSFRILIYKGDVNKTLVVNHEGKTELILPDLVEAGTLTEEDLQDVTEVVLSGGNQDATGSVRILSLYMETYDDATPRLKDPKLSFSSTQVRGIPGEPVSAPNLVNPYGVSPVTYSSVSTPEGFATVDATTGALTTGTGEGTVTVTASFAGNETYKASEASYTVVVKELFDIADGHWVGTWATAPMVSGSNNNPPSPGLAGNSLRQIVQVSVGGDMVRLKLSNHFGDSPVEIKAVELSAALTSGSSADVDENTTVTLTFDGYSNVTIPAGEMVVSDAVQFPIEARGNVAITIHYGQASSTTVCGHPGSRTTSYLKSGSTTDFSGASTTDHWYHVLALEVAAPEEWGCVAVLGNSITDGRGSTTNKQDRWTDAMSRQLLANSATSHIGVLNLGIGGNCVVRGGLGPAAVSRYQRDLFGQEGVKWIILFEGVNDLGGSRDGVQTGKDIVNVWKQIIREAHQQGIRVFGATITPFKNNSYYSTDHEAGRQYVNNWIRTTKMLDGVIDFDEAVRSDGDKEALNSKYLFENDWLHLNASGYDVMGKAVPLDLFLQDGPLGADDEPDPDQVQGLWIEAESLQSGEYGGNLRLVDDASASEGRCLETVINNTDQSSNPADQLKAEFPVDEQGTYYVYARVKCPSYDDDSYYVRVDDSGWTMENGLYTGGSWEWRLLYSGQLEAGSHRLFICTREDGAFIDKLCVTTSAAPPTGIGDQATAIRTAVEQQQTDLRTYSLAGLVVPASYKGLVVSGGRKMLIK